MCVSAAHKAVTDAANYFQFVIKQKVINNTNKIPQNSNLSSISAHGRHQEIFQGVARLLVKKLFFSFLHKRGKTVNFANFRLLKRN